MVYKWYILPIGALYGTYHLLTEPGNSIDIIAARGKFTIHSLDSHATKPYRMIWVILLRLHFSAEFQDEDSFTVWETYIRIKFQSSSFTQDRNRENRRGYHPWLAVCYLFLGGTSSFLWGRDEIGKEMRGFGSLGTLSGWEYCIYICI